MAAQKRKRRAPETRIGTASQLHASSCRETRDAVCWHTVAEVITQSAITIGVVARKIEEVDTGEDDEEAAKEGDGVYGGSGVETAEEEEGSDECARRERDIVKRVDAVFFVSKSPIILAWDSYMLVENWLSALLK